MKAAKAPLTTRPRECGVTLIELMISMTLGLVLIAGLLQFFSANKKLYRTQSAMTALKENGRFAMDIIARDLRNAGFLGCVGNTSPPVNTLNTSGGVADSYSSPLAGYEASSNTAWTPAVDSFVESPLGGTDVLITKHPNQSSRTHVLTHTGNNIKLADKTSIDYDDVVLLADCANSAIFKVTDSRTDTDGLPIVTYDPTKSLGREFTRVASIQQMATTAYFVRQSGTSSGRPALWRRDSSGAAQELVEGVENLQIRYGVDTDNDRVPNQYYTADLVADWTNVVTVRLELLLGTIDDQVIDQVQAYSFNGTRYDGVAGTGHGALPKDRRYRQTYTATVAIRNNEP